MGKPKTDRLLLSRAQLAVRLVARDVLVRKPAVARALLVPKRHSDPPLPHPPVHLDRRARDPWPRVGPHVRVPKPRRSIPRKER
jgi:hypothetical protein